MKKIVTVLLTVVLSYTAIAQQGNPNPTKQHRAYVDSLLATIGIGRQDIPTGILYDRSIAIASLQGFKQEKHVNRGFLMQAALELRNASYERCSYPQTSIYGVLPNIMSTGKNRFLLAFSILASLISTPLR